MNAVIQWKFVGFIYTLLALVLLIIFAPESKFVDIAVGGLIGLLTGMGRDLYRSSTQNGKGKEI